MLITKARLIAAGALTACTFSILGAGAAYAVQTHMLDAQNDLQSGLGALQQAEPDKGGHRDQAINLVQQALSQVEQGIQFGR